MGLIGSATALVVLLVAIISKAVSTDAVAPATIALALTYAISMTAVLAAVSRQQVHICLGLQTALTPSLGRH